VLITAALEQRVNIKFCIKLGEKPTETYEMLQTVYDHEALSRSSVFGWFKRFKDGRGVLQYDPRSGRLSTSRNAYRIANVREMLTRDFRMTLRMMSDELNIIRRRFFKSSMKIYGRARSAQSSPHTV
jgi:transposase